MITPLNVYFRWATEAALNAVSLAEEAQILMEHDKHERAYYLAHMALEESVKALTLMKHIDSKTPPNECSTIQKQVSSHKVKLVGLIEMFDQIEASHSTNVNNTKNPSFSQLKKVLIPLFNNKKNNTMYVSWFKGKIQTPRNAIRDTNVNVTVKAAQELSVEINSFLKKICAEK